MTKILHETEEPIDYLEIQNDLIRTLGEPNYLRSALGDVREALGEG